MSKLEPGDKIDRVIGQDVIYTMVVQYVTDKCAFADIPGGSEPYEFQREYSGTTVRNLYPGAEAFVKH